ncbi:MAG: putative bifunctional diguanylate cyclase/phosphodiesterase [Pseudomonadota bacterium]
MFKQLTGNLAASLISMIAINCLVFGALGLGNLIISQNAQLMPALTPLMAFASLLTGAALLCRARRFWRMTRVFGILLVGLGTYAIYSPMTQLSVFLPPATILVGTAFTLSFAKPRSIMLYRLVGSILLVLTTFLFLSLWLRGYTTAWATNPVAITAAMVIAALVGIALLVLKSSDSSYTKTSKTGYLVASAVIITTTLIWFVLANNNIQDIKERGRLNLQKSSEAISSRLSSQVEAIQRLVERWNTVGADSMLSLIELDSASYLKDFDLIESLIVFNPSESSESYTIRSGSSKEFALLEIPSIKEWQQQHFSKQSAVIVEKSLQNAEPRFLMSYPIVNPNQPPRQLIVTINLKKLLAIAKIQYLDIFKTYLELSDNYLLPINQPDFATRPLADLSNEHFFQLTTALSVFGEQPMQFHAVLKDSSVFWESATINQTVLLVGIALALLILLTIESNHRLARERSKLFKIANFDSVTHLIRRDVLEQRINSYLIKNSNKECCILFVDLDGFKAINDNLGLRVGNELLQTVAQRLLLNEQKGIEIARFSSDEFILFIPGQSVEQSSIIAKHILQQVRQKFEFHSLDLHLTASIGIACRQGHSVSAESMIQNADVAMSHAKQSGGNTFQVFNQAMGIQYENELKLRNHIQRAIDNHEFEVFYQPYIAANSKKIIGAEALVRWRLPTGEYVSPAEFIPVAEQTGQIIPLSKLIMEAAFRDLADLPVTADFILSVNLSVKQFQRGNIISDISVFAEKYQITLSQLQFELTESVMVEDAPKVFNELAELRTIGCKVAIDDFGTGFSSLAYLSRLPVDIIKIDREFTRSIFTVPANQIITKAIIDMAHGLEKSVIVEGIETEQEAHFFTRHGCMGLQGFLFYKPMPFEQLKQLLT